MEKGTIKPLRDLVLIELDQREQKTGAGIFIQKAWEDAVNSATVVEVGPEVTSCKKGDRIMINPYAYIDLNGMENTKLIRQEDILANV